MSTESEVKALEKNKHVMDKYSRQIGEFGVAAMAKLVQMKVLLIGLEGVGIEIAKNLILQGVGELAIYDENKAQIADLGTNFYLKEEHVGKVSRAEASLPQLKSLNPLVKVSVHTGPITNKTVKKFSVVVDCGLSMKEGILCDAQCRRAKSQTKYIRARVHGLVGYYFSDFGDNFTVIDKTGEPPVSRLIDRIENNPENPDEIIVRLVADKPHMMQLDDHTGFIKFDEVLGELGKQLNKTEKPFVVKEAKRKTTEGKLRNDPFALRVLTGNIGSDLSYDEGGKIIQDKVPVSLKYKSLEESLVSPIHPNIGYLPPADTCHFEQPPQLHIALNGLWAFETEENRLPRANNEVDVAKVVEHAKQYNELMKKKEGAVSVEKLDEGIVEKLAKFAALQFQPLCCFFGGVVAQEVVKFTGKYTPLEQWLTLACFDVLPEENVEEDNTEVFKPTEEDRKPIGSRYDDLIQIIGRPLHEKLMKSSTFMVGCGALGCELLKNFALLGVASSEGKEGLITVTDNDNIEISNLSRQFLFRENNVGEPKSIAAGNAVKDMNASINVKSMENLVSPDSEGIFTGDFWRSLDFVTNALDNVKARLYVDSQCVFYSKPLLESGTLGVKCNSQVIIPHLTESYSDGTDTDLGDAIPMCTLRNFPTAIEHCIEWSRAKFTDMFETDSTKASKYLADPDAYIEEMKAKFTDLSAVSNEMNSLKQVIHILKTASDPNSSFTTCVEEAYYGFYPLFRDNILSLINAKPEDAKDEDGNPFWGKVKRFPQAGLFDIDNSLHLEFVLSMANILSLIYGITSTTKEFNRDLEAVKKICAGLTPPPEKLQKVDLSNEGDEGQDVVEDTELDEFTALVAELEAIKTTDGLKDIRVEPASFEKDDDENCHIDFITTASNMRGWNYRMQAAPRHKCKMIAGKIIPAIATTTASITGLICVEMLKLIQPGKKLDAFRESSNSLGVNNYVLNIPSEPKKAKNGEDLILLCDIIALPTGFTKWDKTFVEGKGLTIRGFMEAFSDTTEKLYKKRLTITTLLHNYASVKGNPGYSKFLYSEDEPAKYDLDLDLAKTITETYGENALGSASVALEISCCDDDGEFYKVPKLVYVFA